MNFWTGSGFEYGMFSIPGNSLMSQHAAMSQNSPEAIGIAFTVFAVITVAIFVALKLSKTPVNS
jgi:hypothetical protein